MSQFYVTFLNDDGKGGRGSANADGSFSGRVEAGVSLEFTIQYFEADCDTIIHQEFVGPFDQDIDLGEIIVDTEGFPSKPVAMFIVNQDNNQPLTYSFTNTSSVSGISDTSFSSLWDFGVDGISTANSPSHTFSTGGFHDITLTITAADGEVATITQTIEVGGISNKYARITDTNDLDIGELRLALEESILTGRVSYVYRVSEGQEMDIKDAFINVSGTKDKGKKRRSFPILWIFGVLLMGAMIFINLRGKQDKESPIVEQETIISDYQNQSDPNPSNIRTVDSEGINELKQERNANISETISPISDNQEGKKVDSEKLKSFVTQQH